MTQVTLEHSSRRRIPGYSARSRIPDPGEALVTPEPALDRDGWMLFGSVAALAVLLPFGFGGVQPVFVLLARIAVAVAVVHAVRIAERRRVRTFAPGSLSSTVMLLFLLQIAVVVVQGGMSLFRSTPHPLFGVVWGLEDRRAWLSGLEELTFFVGVWVLGRLAADIIPRGSARLGKLFLGTAALFAFIALAQWFSDNGKLLWVFAPNSEFLSTRVRWPFVNSNHLGTFLLLPLFLAAGLNAIGILEVQDALHAGRCRGIKLARLFNTRPEFQLLLSKVIALTMFVLVLCVTITGTLSRGTWIGMVAGGMIFALGAAWARRRSAAVKMQHLGADEHGRPLVVELEGHRRKRGRGRSATALLGTLRFPRVVSGPVMALAGFGMFALLFLFLLNERGTELLGERLNFAFTHSLDDIRWMMWGDALHMLASAPFLGIGLGQWISSFHRRMGPEFGGMDPYYLHSDPLQFLVEMGVVGSLPLLILTACVAWRALKAVARMDLRSNFVLLGLLSGTAAALIGSLSDFPFRTSAVTSYMAFYLALLVGWIDGSGVTDEAEVPSSSD